MTLEGGCFCGGLRYKAEGEPVLKGQCHCRQCQYHTGGAPFIFMALPEAGFTYTHGQPKTYARANAPVLPIEREFCPECGVQIVSRSPGLPLVFLKIGTLDDPAAFSGPEAAIFTCDKQDFHHIPDGMPTFEKLPPM